MQMVLSPLILIYRCLIWSSDIKFFHGYFTEYFTRHYVQNSFYLMFKHIFTGYFTGHFTCIYDHNSSYEVNTFFPRVFHRVACFLLQWRDVSQAISHVSFNSNIILKSSQKFHIIFHRNEFCSINLLKSVCASQDISQGVSHPKKIHMVFT